MTDSFDASGTPFDGLHPQAAGGILQMLQTPDEAAFAGDEAVTAVLPPAELAMPEIPGYHLSRFIGAGGCGRVFEATRGEAAERLAVKMLKATLGEGRAGQRARRELDLLSELTLDCVPRLVDYGVSGGHLFLVTPFVDGCDLFTYCEESLESRRERVLLVAKVADAVHRLHERGIIHRDLKPGNILVRPSGDPVIIDLGIASLVDRPVESITEEGAPLGSPAFMSPEQARGERARLSIRSDIYSLGATAVLCLTGKTPHDMNTSIHESVRRVAQDEPRDPMELDPTMPDVLAAILRRAMAQNPTDRYESAAAFAADLRRWWRGDLIEWTKPSRLEILRHSVRRYPWMWTTGAMGVALLVVATIGLMQMRNVQLLRIAVDRAEADAAIAMAARDELAAAQISRLQSILVQQDAIEQKQQMAADALRDTKNLLETWAMRLRNYQSAGGAKELDGAFLIAYVLRQVVDEARVSDTEFEARFGQARRRIAEDALQALWPRASVDAVRRAVSDLDAPSP
ncbi:MAG: serine/threonine protein kinase [Phycisphaerales bacterium]|nr:serine/threonine protein kinase [Phycisphaerales bacterium]